jgi:hypothetical protein
MIDRMRPKSSPGQVAVIGVILLSVLASSMTGFAQDPRDVQALPSPLVLQSRGSFMVGGESVLQTPAQLSSFTGQQLDSGGHVTINQMYVEYMVPMADNGIPVVMLHGATLSGKSYDTTPDGRMGWHEYFVRDEQIATLATKPILVVFGDHLDAQTGTIVSWRAQYDDCRAFIARVNAAGGAAEMLHPPDLGIRGNSHMIMQDRNNLQIADLIRQWIGRTTRGDAAGSR